MSTQVAIRIPTEVVDRIDREAALAGETRTERILRWLPAYYGEDWNALPEASHVPGPTTLVNLRMDGDLLKRIDAAASRHGITRTDYVLRWQPDHYHYVPIEGAPDEAVSV